MAANTGILGDDYAQFGWASIMLYPWMRAKILHIGFDRPGCVIPSQLMLFLSFIFAIGFISGSFFSRLLTGGFLVVSFLLLYMNNRNKIIRSHD